MRGGYQPIKEKGPVKAPPKSQNSYTKYDVVKGLVENSINSHFDVAVGLCHQWFGKDFNPDLDRAAFTTIVQMVQIEWHRVSNEEGKAEEVAPESLVLVAKWLSKFVKQRGRHAPTMTPTDLIANFDEFANPHLKAPLSADVLLAHVVRLGVVFTQDKRYSLNGVREILHKCGQVIRGESI